MRHIVDRNVVMRRIPVHPVVGIKQLFETDFIECLLLFNHYLIRKMLEVFNKFNVYGSVHRKNILIYIQQDATLHSLFYLETALHVSNGTSTHHQERIQLYMLLMMGGVTTRNL